MIRPPILTALFALLMTACATPASSPQSQSALRDKESALLSTSRIELVYVLGHVHRRLELQAKEGNILGRHYYERQMLKEVAVGAPGYETYWNKISDYAAKHPAKDPDLDTSCTNIYRITLETPQSVRKIEGCRTHTTDDSQLSHLIREGEFLMTRRSPAAVSPTPR